MTEAEARSRMAKVYAAYLKRLGEHVESEFNRRLVFTKDPESIDPADVLTSALSHCHDELNFEVTSLEPGNYRD